MVASNEGVASLEHLFTRSRLEPEHDFTALCRLCCVEQRAVGDMRLYIGYLSLKMLPGATETKRTRSCETCMRNSDD
ncbi:hypothetical protein HPB50_016556 [Hyalomma asiaticum]|uniref:Uncharacterized protein n=1 Tax=Hyalomma asiaticum TaxID=266040 RepID=A0ACB7SYV7_HYAAI|nr:hypothetical protein HPB50_016556 [Hyalomma asiaticum]